MEDFRMDRIGDGQDKTSSHPSVDSRYKSTLRLLEDDATNDRDSFHFVNSGNSNSFHSGYQSNITGLDNLLFSDNEGTTSSHQKTESNAERLKDDGDMKEEEEAVTKPGTFGDDRSGGIAGSRKARTRWWPPQSDPHKVYLSFQQHRAEVGDRIITLGQGQDSGRNRLAIFQDIDNTPRLAYNIRVEGRTGTQWEGYRSPRKVFLPVGASLSEILAHYPNHVWNDGLRLFMAEGWQAEKMWNILPTDARNDGANTRKWNYLQQALGREADKVGQEQFGEKRVPDKRRKEGVVGLDNKSDTVAVESNAGCANNLVGGLQTRLQVLPSNNPHIMTAHALAGSSFMPGAATNFAVSGEGRGRSQVLRGGDGSFSTTWRRGPTGLAHPGLVN
jgi:hypothetical protein